MVESRPEPGRVERVAPGVFRLTAPNPSPMTGPGTNSYLVGDGPYVVIDPGSDDAEHLDRLWHAATGRIAAVLLTHRHPDHSSGAEALAARAGAPLRAWPKPVPGAHDRSVTIDRPLTDAETLAAGGLTLVVRHTPGHAADHVCFEVPQVRLLLAGDVVMADGTVVILPPDGSMGDYLRTLAGLARRPIERLAPAHGRVLSGAPRVLENLIAHRRAREAQVAAALSPDESRSPEALAARLYPALHASLRPMAARQVEAHLLHLAEQGRAVSDAAGWRAVAG